MKIKSSIRGVTLIELIIAMVMTAALAGIVFVVWNNFNRHIINQNRKSQLQSEVRRFSGALISQIRRSPAVLAWHSSGITYVSPTKGDTVSYEFYADELLKNGSRVPVVSQAAYISEFLLSESAQNAVEQPDLTVLCITMTLSDDFSNDISINACVAAKVVKAGEGAEQSDSWNF